MDEHRPARHLRALRLSRSRDRRAASRDRAKPRSRPRASGRSSFSKSRTRKCSRCSKSAAARPTSPKRIAIEQRESDEINSRHYVTRHHYHRGETVMIVTRQRKQKKSSLPILLPIAAIAMLVIAVTWPPSHNFIVNGPLKPVATVVRRRVGRGLEAADVRLSAAADHRSEHRHQDAQRQAREPIGRRRPTRTPRSPSSRSTIAANERPARCRDPGSGGPARRSARRPQPAGAPPAAPRRARPAAPTRSAATPSSGRRWTPKRPPPSCKSCRPATFRPSSPRCRPTRSVPSWTLCRAKVAALIVESSTAPQISAQPGR